MLNETQSFKLADSTISGKTILRHTITIFLIPCGLIGGAVVLGLSSGLDEKLGAIANLFSTAIVVLLVTILSINGLGIIYQGWLKKLMSIFLLLALLPLLLNAVSSLGWLFIRSF